MFNIETGAIKDLEKRLQDIKSKALPYATRQTLNDTAFAAQKIIKADLPGRFILKNKYVLRSIRVDQARGSKISAQQSIVGSTAPEMATQEEGGFKYRKAGRAVGIPTGFSAGQTNRRTKLPRKAYQMATIALRRGAKGHSRKQRNLIAFKENQGGFAYMDLGRRKGIFKINKRGVKMVHDLSRASVRIKKNEWMKPAGAEALRMLPAFYADALRYQLARL